MADSDSSENASKSRREERQAFRDFCNSTYTVDMVEEQLSRGHTVTSIYEKSPTFVEHCNLSQYPLLSDSDRRAAVLGASEALFDEVLTFHQILILCCPPNTLREKGFVTQGSDMEKLCLRTLQASNKTAAQFLASYLASYHFFASLDPTGLVKVFKCLVALGFDPSGVMSAKRMEEFPVCTAYWKGRPQLSLKHLARVAVRDAINTNVVHAAPRLGLPTSLQSYLLLEDILESDEEEYFNWDQEF